MGIMPRSTMEEPEVPLEASQEHIQHHALHGGSEEEESGGRKWVLGVALSSAIFAALAAVASLQAGHHANEAIVAQIEGNNEVLKASDQWTYYQAKGVKGAIVASRVSLLKSFDKTPPADDLANVARYAKEQEDISKEAKEHEHKADEFKREGQHHLETHIPLARAVTLFQVSIAVSAIAVLTRRKAFWYVSLIFGAVGVFFVASGFLR